MNKKNHILSAIILVFTISSYFSFSSIAADMNSTAVIESITTESIATKKSVTVNNVVKIANTSIEYKNELMNKLSNIDQFSALFEQEVIDNAGNVLQRGGGNLSVKRPNLVYWNTESPDESLIVSDGKSIFLYDPFIEQVTAYKLDGAIANTPILLITTNDTALWEQYSVSRISKNNYVIHANDINSRITTLEINFNEQSELSGFTFLDVTGQLSQVSLKNIDLSPDFLSSIFTFSIPEGVYLDDQR